MILTFNNLIKTFGGFGSANWISFKIRRPEKYFPNFLSQSIKPFRKNYNNKQKIFRLSFTVLYSPHTGVTTKYGKVSWFVEGLPKLISIFNICTGSCSLYHSIKALVCQWVSLFVCLFPNSSKTTNPSKLKFWGMIPLGMEKVLG